MTTRPLLDEDEFCGRGRASTLAVPPSSNSEFREFESLSNYCLGIFALSKAASRGVEFMRLILLYLNFPAIGQLPRLSSTKIADHSGRKRARNHSAAEIAGFFASPAAKKSLAASDFGVSLKIAGSSQRPRPQVAAAARFCGRSDHGTLSPAPPGTELLISCFSWPQVAGSLFEGAHGIRRGRLNLSPQKS